MKIKRRPPRKPPAPEIPLRARLQIEEAEDTDAAADLCRAILQAQELTRKEEAKNNAA